MRTMGIHVNSRVNVCINTQSTRLRLHLRTYRIVHYEKKDRGDAVQEEEVRNKCECAESGE